MLISCSSSGGSDDYEEPPMSIPFSDLTFDDINFWIGEGENKAMLIIQWNDEKTPAALAWGYRWKSEEAKRGIDMVYDIVEAYPNLFALVFNNEIGGFGYNLNGGSFAVNLDGNTIMPDSNGLFITDLYNFDDYAISDSEDRWQSGYFEGTWSYWGSDSLGGKLEYSGLSAYARKLVNGSVDAWYFDAEMYNDNSVFYRCMLLGEDCDGRDFFCDVFPVAKLR